MHILLGLVPLYHGINPRSLSPPYARRHELEHAIATKKSAKHLTAREVERIQTGVRLEKRLLKVLKGLAEYLDLSLGDLLEGVALHALENKPPFKPTTLEKAAQLRRVYGLDLVAADSHRLRDKLGAAKPSGVVADSRRKTRSRSKSSRKTRKNRNASVDKPGGDPPAGEVSMGNRRRPIHRTPTSRIQPAGRRARLP